ncbi:ubiquitin conjugation factor E4 [Aulographum hederae CBS 113979]|uniref:Ubiquitin conjugation factor E4 n=1 Tax=Aulographum hederae CBS 113979 TaxID=1176131 RepID=A0A6G1H4E8_9PEZI|nr:ubiquitin conjugation factor E4 [Aulographum hederae CBS 113979]
MADSLSDAEKIRNKRLAKLGGNQSAASSTKDVSAPAADASSSSSSPSNQNPRPEPNTKPPSTSSPASLPASNPFAQMGSPKPAESPQTKRTPTITISKKAEAPPPRPRSRAGQPESIEVWQDRTLSNVFRISLNPDNTKDAHGNRIYYVPGVRADVEVGAPVQFNMINVEPAIVEAASNLPTGNPLDYLLGCWKRVTRMARTVRSGGNDPQKNDIAKEARRICFSYCIFAATMPEMFGQDSAMGDSPLTAHLLCDPEDDRGLCHDFLSEAVARTQEDDDSALEALVQAMEQLSANLSELSMNDNYKPYVLALRNFVRYTPLAMALTQSTKFLAQGVTAERIESDTFLGPFFALSPLQGEVAVQYFRGAQARDEGYIRQSQSALRMSLQTHQDELLDITNCIIKSSKEPREKMLDYFALAVNANHKRRAMQVDPKAVSSDGFMVNITGVLDRLCEPFIDTTFSKLDRIDADYLRRSPRVIIKDETKMNADQKTSDDFYSEKVGGESNFISELFFLTVAAHHYGTEAANTKLGSLQREVKHLEQHIEKFRQEREKFQHVPAQLALFESHLKKFEDQLERGKCVIRATQGVLLDELAQRRSMQFMRYVIVWMLKLATPGSKYPKEPLQLPLPTEQPMAFRCLPEYFLEDVTDNFKFVTRQMPQIILSTQSEELVQVCVAFLRSSEYIKNPGVKSSLVTILFHGTWPVRGREKGVLGDLLNGSDFCYKHLLHSLMKQFIECESTGTHTQFYDKFNIRYEIFQVIRCIWTNTVYRENLAAESSRINIDFFVHFVNLLLNDVTFVLDESFTAFAEITKISKELRNESHDLDESSQQAKKEAIEAAQSKAKSYMSLVNETVSMLGLFTEALADSFTMPEIVQRLADMLDYNLDALTGPKQTNLKVENPQEYNFRPSELLADLLSVYINLGGKSNFQYAVARDGRSYKPSNFKAAIKIMNRFTLKSPEELAKFEKVVEAIEKAKQEDEQVEEDLGEVPDDFLDPLVYTLMEDPVILPTSKTIIDRSTIRSHLLSDPTDPFNRSPLKIEDVLPATEMKERIETWKKEKKDAARAAAKGDPMDTSN